MPRQIKDYYITLEVSPVSSMAEIKKSYRKLAFKYHPDTNPGNHFASAMFIEIQEAYAVLSDAVARSKYDEERWLNGMTRSMHDQAVITPMWLQNECRKLQTHMSAVDTYRMDHRALYQYVLLILSDKHLAILTEANDQVLNESIFNLIMLSCKCLRYEYMALVADRLKHLAGNSNIILQKLELQLRDSRMAARSIKYMPLLIALLTLLLCVIMYLWVNKK